MRLILSDYEGETIVLIGTNHGLVEQVARQHQIRNWYYRHPAISFAYAPLLYIKVEYKGTAMLLDSRQIVVRFFAPQTTAEKLAVAMAEAHVMRAKTFQSDEAFRDKVIVELAQANELIWLAVTGQYENDEQPPKKSRYSMTGRGTWNSYEPILY